MAGIGFKVNFSAPEIQVALDQIKSYDGKSRLQIEKVVSDSVKAIRAGAVSRVGSHTGYLKKNIRSNFSVKTVTGQVKAKSRYAHLIEFGARATIVRPRLKKSLKIYSPGAIFFTKIAHIPARPPRPFMRPAFEDEKPNLISGLEKAVQP